MSSKQEVLIGNEIMERINGANKALDDFFKVYESMSSFVMVNHDFMETGVGIPIKMALNISMARFEAHFRSAFDYPRDAKFDKMVSYAEELRGKLFHLVQFTDKDLKKKLETGELVVGECSKCGKVHPIMPDIVKKNSVKTVKELKLKCQHCKMMLTISGITPEQEEIIRKGNASLKCSKGHQITIGGRILLFFDGLAAAS